MSTKEFLLNLEKAGILTQGKKNGNNYYHLTTPCKIEISDEITSLLKSSYEADKEKGGLLIALPVRKNEEIYLIIKKVVFLTNVSETPEKSYSPNSQELQKALSESLFNDVEKTLPIRFHTHPTRSSSPFNEIVNYLFQANTSKQDQIVSDNPITVENINLLMPRSIALCNGTSADRMFIGFYNGLIAPIEFESHRRERIQEAIENIQAKIEELADKGNNKWVFLGSGILLAIGVIKYPKVAIPLTLLLTMMMPMFINDKHSKPKYFAQLSKGKVVIEIP